MFSKARKTAKTQPKIANAQRVQPNKVYPASAAWRILQRTLKNIERYSKMSKGIKSQQKATKGNKRH